MLCLGVFRIDSRSPGHVSINMFPRGFRRTHALRIWIPCTETRAINRRIKVGVYEWEEGIIALPSAEFAKVRQAVQKAETEYKQEVFDLTQEFWKGLNRRQQTDPSEYARAVDTFVRDKGRERARLSPGAWRNTEGDWTRDQVLGGFSRAVHGPRRPERVLKANMDFPTNRTTEFGALGCHLIFDKANNRVEWHVEEGKRARERARALPITQAFFGALDQVRWTRGTGGAFTGNDEHNAEDREFGSGGNYITTAFGPTGADVDPNNCRPYIDSKGRRVTETDLMMLGRVQRDARLKAAEAAQKAYEKSVKASGVQPRGHNGHAGQYTYRTNGEPGFRL